MSHKLSFIFEYVSTVLASFKAKKPKKAPQNKPKVYTSILMTAGKDALNHDLNATFCLLNARSQTEVVTSRAREQAVQISHVRMTTTNKSNKRRNADIFFHLSSVSTYKTTHPLSPEIRQTQFKIASRLPPSTYFINDCEEVH